MFHRKNGNRLRTGVAAPSVPPVLSAATLGTLTDVGGVPTVTTDTGNGTLYYAVVTNGGSATNAQIKAGTGGNIVAGKASSQAVVSTGVKTFSAVTGLTANTTYQILYLQTSAGGSDSNQASYSFTTISLYISSSSASYNQNLTGQTGAVKLTGFSTWSGLVDLPNNSYSSLDCSQIVTSNGRIEFPGNGLTSINFNSLTSITERIYLFQNNLVTASFPALTTTAAGKHIYLSQNFTLTSASFPSLVTASGAIVLSRDYNLTSVDFSALTTLNHEVELDYTKALTSVSFPSLTTINATVSGPSLTLGGDMTDIGQTRPPALNSVSWPLFANVNDADIRITWCTNLTTLDPSPWTTITNGVHLDFNRCNLDQSTQDAILAKLVAILGGVTVGYLDLRFQSGGATPSAIGYGNKATLQAAWGAGNVLTS